MLRARSRSGLQFTICMKITVLAVQYIKSPRHELKIFVLVPAVGFEPTKCTNG